VHCRACSLPPIGLPVCDVELVNALYIADCWGIND
jgi:hypothetical protein